MQSYNIFSDIFLKMLKILSKIILVEMTQYFRHFQLVRVLLAIISSATNRNIS